ncbi:hypothetical protein OEB99_19295 [Actinotalea sp. M2MS4P-6]|uniref:hypothetical protein n=1 Tax=Actinotalea sp. M2MS4P-6 TaxID=2983762 RepID=UPI0021E47D1C|nr:hypothetical protein [Actinotalea sp. M2MS4P-6]MCV2396462.1 hypothetical protein [Actinotalea sp. M2MS4P-6]
MFIDCGQCAVRGDACADCVVTFLTIGAPERDVETPGVASATAADLDAAERRAISVLARSGLVPPLRLEDRREAI